MAAARAEGEAGVRAESVLLAAARAEGEAAAGDMLAVEAGVMLAKGMQVGVVLATARAR
jgi:hypothetical protein